MALSGSQNWSIDRDTLIKTAMQNMGAIGIGETPTSEEYTEGSILLNMLIKYLQADDIQLWIRKYGYIIPRKGTNAITLGGESSYVVSSYVHTTVSVAASSGASSFTVTSATGVSASNLCGIELDDGTMQWVTISSPSGNNISIFGDTLDDDVSVGNQVFFYPSSNVLTERPMTMLTVFRRLLSDSTDTPMKRMDEKEYNNLSSKTTATTPVQWYYDETLGFGASGSPGSGTLYIWPQWSDYKSVLVYRYIKPFDDLDSSTNNFEFPQMWFLPLMLGMSWLFSNKYGLPIKERNDFFNQFQITKKSVVDFDQEDGSLFLIPTESK